MATWTHIFPWKEPSMPHVISANKQDKTGTSWHVLRAV